MKKNILPKKIRKIFGGMVMAAFMAAISIPVYAMEDGAYTVGRSTSYVNPQTGNTVDGGTNIALGDSMCASIVEQQALVEQYQGSTYVTLGLGLMSNVSNVRIQIQGADGSYRDVAITQTGSCSRDGDTCNHYRFAVDSAENYISPILYVTPMGRDVQFFVKLDTGSAVAGNGNFVSEMVPVVTENEGVVTPATETAPEIATESAQNTVNNQTEEGNPEKLESQESENTETDQKETEKKSKTNKKTSKIEKKTETTKKAETKSAKKKTSTVVVWLVGLIIIIAAGGGGYIFYRKKKEKK